MYKIINPMQILGEKKRFFLPPSKVDTVASIAKQTC